jgi:hypothetical protein
MSSPEDGIKLLGLLLAGSTGQHMASPDIHLLGRDKGGLVAAIMSLA